MIEILRCWAASLWGGGGAFSSFGGGAFSSFGGGAFSSVGGGADSLFELPLPAPVTKTKPQPHDIKFRTCHAMTHTVAIKC
jgi:hypothetical protein